jgi:hypothetical protein
MRRAVASATIVALMLAAVALPAKAASAGDRYKARYYEGPTTEGGRLRIVVLVSDGMARLGSLVVDPGPYRCEDGTEGEIGTGVAWVGHGGPVLSRISTWSCPTTGQVIAFGVFGRLGVHRGSGTVTFLLPGLTTDEQAQVCAIGELAWTVERTAPDGGFPFGRAALVQRLDEGRTVTMDLGATGSGGTSVVARAEAGPTRHYRGRTSLDLPMAAQTRRVDTGIELLALSLGSSLRVMMGANSGEAPAPSSNRRRLCRRGGWTWTGPRSARVTRFTSTASSTRTLARGQWR